jgi:hypothetical protein
LLKYKAAPGPGQRPPRRDQTDDEETTGVYFLQDGSLIPGTDGEIHHGIKCFNCNKKGHYASSCPNSEGVQLLQMANIDIDGGDDTYESAFLFLYVGHQPEECLFTQAATGHNLIPLTWILLDTQRWDVADIVADTSPYPSPYPPRSHDVLLKAWFFGLFFYTSFYLPLLSA